MWVTTWQKVYKKRLLIVKFRETNTGKEDWTYFLIRDCDTEEECQIHSEEDMRLFTEASNQLHG